ncbi:hypothetical protein B296_00032417, partial [Ensete ventricosum]
MQDVTQNHHVNLKVATKSKDATIFEIPSVDHPGRKQKPKAHKPTRSTGVKIKNNRSATKQETYDPTRSAGLKNKQHLNPRTATRTKTRKMTPSKPRNPRPNPNGRLKGQAAFESKNRPAVRTHRNTKDVTPGSAGRITRLVRGGPASRVWPRVSPGDFVLAGLRGGAVRFRGGGGAAARRRATWRAGSVRHVEPPVCASSPVVFSVQSAGAFIVSVVNHSYLVTLLLLWPTTSSYPFTTLVVLVVRRAFAGRGCRPYLRQVGCTTTGAPHTCIRSVARVGSATSTGQLSEGMTWRPGQRLSYHSPPLREDLLEAPDEGAEDEVLCLTAGSRSPWTSSEVNSTEQEPGDCDVARADLTEQELENCDVARVDPTEEELGNCDVARVDPTEQELGNCDVARVDLTEQELGNYDFRLLIRVSLGANPGIWPRGRTWAQIWRFGRGGELGHESGSLVKRANSGANLEVRPRRDLAERVNSGVNPEIWPR